MTASTFVYDGDCAFCATCVRLMQRYVPSRVRVLPWQVADLDALHLTRERCEAAVQWVGPDGGQAAGPDAIARVLGESRLGWRVLGRLLRLPPVRLITWPAYRWVARNRHRMPGGAAACALPLREG